MFRIHRLDSKLLILENLFNFIVKNFKFVSVSLTFENLVKFCEYKLLISDKNAKNLVE